MKTKSLKDNNFSQQKIMLSL